MFYFRIGLVNLIKSNKKIIIKKKKKKKVKLYLIAFSNSNRLM